MSIERIVTVLLEDDDEVEDFMKRRIDELRYPETSEVKFELSTDQEISSVDDHFDDPRDRRWVKQQIKLGNPWAWFQAVCYAGWTDPDGNFYMGRDSLGGCSYASMEDFKQPGGCWDDMKSEAYHDLISKIRIARGASGTANE